MAIAAPRRYLFPALAGLIVLVLALWQWVGPQALGPSSIMAGRGINTIGWTTTKLTLAGQTDPNAKAVLLLNDKEYPAAVDDKGAFVVTATAEQKSPTRATLKLNKDTYSVVLMRLQGEWIALQRVTDGPAAATATDRGWLPAAGLYDDIAVRSAILTVTRDDRGFAVALATPAEHTTYVYGNNKLTAVIKHGPEAAPAIATLAGDTTQMRLDIYDSADHLAERLRLTLPPADSVAHYDLNDGTVWIFTDFSAQKAEVDESFPGQFVPVTADEPAVKPAPKAVAKPQDKAAPAGQSE